MVQGGEAEVMVEGAEEKEVIKVYIFNADPEDADLGESASKAGVFGHLVQALLTVPMFSVSQGGAVDIAEGQMEGEDGVELLDGTGHPLQEKTVYLSVEDEGE